MTLPWGSSPPKLMWRIFHWYFLNAYQSTVGDRSVNCQQYINQLSVKYQSHVEYQSFSRVLIYQLSPIAFFLNDFLFCFIAISYITLHTKITYSSTFLMSSVYYRMGENVAVLDITLWSKTDSTVFLRVIGNQIEWHTSYKHTFIYKLYFLLYCT